MSVNFPWLVYMSKIQFIEVWFSLWSRCSRPQQVKRRSQRAVWMMLHRKVKADRIVASQKFLPNDTGFGQLENVDIVQLEAVPAQMTN